MLEIKIQPFKPRDAKACTETEEPCESNSTRLNPTTRVLQANLLYLMGEYYSDKRGLDHDSALCCSRSFRGFLRAMSAKLDEDLALADVSDRVLHRSVLGLHDVRNHRELPVVVLHGVLQLQVLHIEGHLSFLHRLRGREKLPAARG